jgi:glutamate synthase (ferredoxin)
MKIMSKMGISTLDSYRSSQIFEAVGLAGDVIDEALVGTPTQIGGIGLAELGEHVLTRHAPAFGEHRQARQPRLLQVQEGRGVPRHEPGGRRCPAPHARDRRRTASSDRSAPTWSKSELTAAHLLSVATDEGRYELYEEFARLVNDRPPAEPRDLLELVEAPSPSPSSRWSPRRSSPAVLHRGDVARCAVARGARDARDGDEHDRRVVELRRGR